MAVSGMGDGSMPGVSHGRMLIWGMVEFYSAVREVELVLLSMDVRTNSKSK